MKALILAGGRGSRLNKLTEDRNKSMLNVFEKPLIEYNLDQAVCMNVKEIIIVVGYKKEEIMEHFGKEYGGTKITYVVQEEQKGVVNAIECAKESIGLDDFVLMLADEIVPEARMKEMMRLFKTEDLFVVCGVVYERDKSSIAKTYSSMVSEKGRVFRLIEKPRFPINNLKGTGHCVLKNQMLDYIDRTPINMNRNQKELVDWIQCAVDEGKKVYVYPLSEDYVNVNTDEDLNLAKEMISKRNPRVLIVHTQMKFLGGAELLILELANWLTKKGIKNDILALSKSKEVENRLINTEIIIPKHNIDLEPPGFKNMKEILDFIKIFRKKIQKIACNYEVINFHNFPVTWTLFPKKKPCVWMLNEPPNLWSKPQAGKILKILNKFRGYVDREIIRNSVDIICVADDFNKNRAEIRYKKTPRIIYYGVNYDFFSKGKANKAIKKWNLRGKFIVVQSGVLSENKNQLESIRAIEKIKDKIPYVVLILAGKPEEEYKKKLDAFIKSKKLEKYVLFAGNLNREELRDLYKAANVGLFPVGQQGGWLAPFELLCSGNPIIVSEEMGASSIVKKFNLGSITKDYAKTLLEIYDGYKEYKKKAVISANFVKKNLGWNVFADKMIQAYKDAWEMHK